MYWNDCHLSLLPLKEEGSILENPVHWCICASPGFNELQTMPGYYLFHLYQPPCSGGRLQNDGVSRGDHLPTIYVGWKIISGGFLNDNKHILRASSQNLLHRIWLHCVQTWKGIMTIAKKINGKGFLLNQWTHFVLALFSWSHSGIQDNRGICDANDYMSH